MVQYKSDRFVNKSTLKCVMRLFVPLVYFIVAMDILCTAVLVLRFQTVNAEVNLYQEVEGVKVGM